MKTDLGKCIGRMMAKEMGITTKGDGMVADMSLMRIILNWQGVLRKSGLFLIGSGLALAKGKVEVDMSRAYTNIDRRLALKCLYAWRRHAVDHERRVYDICIEAVEDMIETQRVHEACVAFKNDPCEACGKPCLKC